MISQPVLSPLMVKATQTLAQNLLASEPFMRYRQAKQRLDADAQARALLDGLSQAQANLRKAQANGAVTQADVQALRDLQTQMHENRAIVEYAASQQEAATFLREINAEISQLLGINFALIAQRSTC